MDYISYTFFTRCLFYIISSLIHYFLKLSNISDLWRDIFLECLDIMTHIEVEFFEVWCCEAHVLDIIPNLTFHYMTYRLFFITRQVRKKNPRVPNHYENSLM